MTKTILTLRTPRADTGKRADSEFEDGLSKLEIRLPVKHVGQTRGIRTERTGAGLIQTRKSTTQSDSTREAQTVGTGIGLIQTRDDSS